MLTRLRITLLVDHQAVQPGLATEHGLSFLVEADERVLLFDTGASDAFLRNAEALDLPIGRVEQVVLSHGHRDHTGGVGAALERMPKAQVVLHPRALGPKFSRHPDRPVREIGFPKESWSAVCPLLHRVQWSTASMLLAPGIGATGPIPRRHPEEGASGPFFQDADGQLADPLEDDQALWIRTPHGLVVLLGCAHAGVINSLERAAQAAGETRIAAVLGGLHLVQASPERLAFTAEALARLKVGRILPCHCAGDEGTAFLEARLGARVQRLEAGSGLTLEDLS